ncbi:MAG: hypothetical protein ACHQWV_02630 [Nitrospirales bacterium]
MVVSLRTLLPGACLFSWRKGQAQGARRAKGVQLVNRPGLHLPGEILLELDRGLIGEVGAHFGFPISRQRRAQADKVQR